MSVFMSFVLSCPSFVGMSAARRFGVRRGNTLLLWNKGLENSFFSGIFSARFIGVQTMLASLCNCLLTKGAAAWFAPCTLIKRGLTHRCALRACFYLHLLTGVLRDRDGRQGMASSQGTSLDCSSLVVRLTWCCSVLASLLEEQNM